MGAGHCITFLNSMKNKTSWSSCEDGENEISLGEILSEKRMQKDKLGEAYSVGLCGKVLEAVQRSLRPKMDLRLGLKVR